MKSQRVSDLASALTTRAENHRSKGEISDVPSGVWIVERSPGFACRFVGGMTGTPSFQILISYSNTGVLWDAATEAGSAGLGWAGVAEDFLQLKGQPLRGGALAKPAAVMSNRTPKDAHSLDTIVALRNLETSVAAEAETVLSADPRHTALTADARQSIESTTARLGLEPN